MHTLPNSTKQPMPAGPPSVVRVTSLRAALRRVARDPSVFVEVFLLDWARVDRARRRVGRAGLAGRIGVHHRAALDMLIHLRVLPDPPLPTTFPRSTLAGSLAGFTSGLAALCGGPECPMTKGVSNE